MEASRITKIAGLGIAGFMVVAGVADRVSLNPLASQVAGFAGAFIGTLVAHRRAKRAAGKQQRPMASSDNQIGSVDSAGDDQ